MNALFYAIADFFEFLFTLMPTVGNATNLLFIGLITFFTIYWIREMKNNQTKHATDFSAELNFFEPRCL
jgi:hypothetical protein